MAGRYGGRWIFGIGTVMTAIFTLFTPLAAYWHIGALIAVRVAEGMFEVRVENIKFCNKFSPLLLFIFMSIGSDTSCNACYLGKVGTTFRAKYTHHNFILW